MRDRAAGAGVCDGGGRLLHGSQHGEVGGCVVVGWMRNRLAETEDADPGREGVRGQCEGAEHVEYEKWGLEGR